MECLCSNRKVSRLKTIEPRLSGLLTHSITGLAGDGHGARGRRRVLKLGPERLGAAMAFDGPVPTTTMDALIVLGIADMGDKAKAMEAMKQLAAELKKTPEEVAKDVLSIWPVR